MNKYLKMEDTNHQTCYSVSEQNNNSSNKYNGLEHRFIGLSPEYWNFIPLFISDVLHRLYLLNGVNCLLITQPINSIEEIPNPEKIFLNDTKSSTNSSGRYRVLPISNCEICGIITYFNHSTKFVQYIVDDGTGSIDCLLWKDSDNDSLLFKLPNISKQGIIDYHSHGMNFQVGDVVRIRGKIKVVSILNTIQGNVKLMDDTTWLVKYCVREIDIKHIDVVSLVDRDLFTAETIHWLKCLQFRKRLSHTRDENDSIPEAQKSELDNDLSEIHIFDTPIYNGSEIESHIKMRDASNTSIDDNSFDQNNGIERGLNKRRKQSKSRKGCTCSNTLCKEFLFYCNCWASTDSLDPWFHFRNALLRKLVDMELQQRQKQKLHDSETNQGTKQESSEKNNTPFQFYFQTMVDDEELQRIASQTVAQTPNPKANIRLLYVNTFHRLREDGVIYLFDQNRDIYWLLSKKYIYSIVVKMIQNEEQYNNSYDNVNSMNFERFPLHATILPQELDKIPGARLRWIISIIKKEEEDRISKLFSTS